MNISKGSSYLILGLLLGGTIVNLFIGERIDSLSTANQTLQNELEVKNSELEELNTALNDSKKHIVTGIQPHVIFPNKSANKFEEQLLEIEVESYIRELLENLQGQEVKDINYLMLFGMVNNRELEYQSKVYSLKVNVVIITDKIIIFVEAVQAKRPS